MNRYLCAGLVMLCAAAPSPAQAPTLKEARQRWLRGNYEEARSLYEALAKDPKQRVAATVGLSRAWQSEGEYDKALAVLDAVLKEHADSADLYARRAELFHLRGQWDEADRAVGAALKANADHFLARWVRARLYQDRGDVKQADAEFRWFVRTYSERSEKDNDIKDADELLLVGLAGTENARGREQLADQFDFILNELYRDALKFDKDQWRAEYQAGMLLLEKYNRGEALEALDTALRINPHAAEALAGKGLAALQKMDFKEAELFAERALRVNPRLPEALRLRADIYFAGGNLAATRRELAQAQKVNPRDERTLARLAACHHLRRETDAFDALVKEVEKQNPKAGVFYHELAEQLEGRRHFDAAEKFYKKSAELLPLLPAPRNGLGLLYTRLGREKEARAVLDQVFKADPFNVRVSNMRKVLGHLDRYETLRTDHFELRYDPKTDRALGRYLGEYLEEAYAELAEKFQYRPKGPILVEVFNNHEMFSGRTVALPDLHTIGACTGRVVTMVSPQGKGVRKPFNWARVLRHELVHIFNLEQTGFMVPHWLTEGLAVEHEGFPRPPSWNQLLLHRVPKGEDLYKLDTIDMGFIRPRSPLDWHLAYCQSQLYVEYLREKHGPRAVGGLLDAYRDGLDTAAAIARVCQVDQAAFEKGYRTYLDGVVGAMKGRPAEKALSFSELKEAHEKDPADLDLAARLAEQYLRRDRAQARKLADAVLAKRKNHPLASVVLARLHLLAGDADRARALLEAAVEKDSPEPKVLRELGKLYYESRQFARAAEVCELGRRAEPYDSEWLVQLARVHAQTGDRAKQIGALMDLVPADADDLENRKRLARLLLEAGRHAEAQRYARQALEISVGDKEAREVLFQALAAQKKDAEAERLRKLLQE